MAIKFIDYDNNRFRIISKSVYHRKYHIENVLMDLSSGFNLNLSVDNKNKIMRIFPEIESIIPHINKNRKRMINTRFVLRKVFELMGLPYKDITVNTSKRTLRFNKQYWKKINSILVDRIKEIIST